MTSNETCLASMVQVDPRNLLGETPLMWGHPVAAEGTTGAVAWRTSNVLLFQMFCLDNTAHMWRCVFLVNHSLTDQLQGGCELRFHGLRESCSLWAARCIVAAFQPWAMPMLIYVDTVDHCTNSSSHHLVVS